MLENKRISAMQHKVNQYLQMKHYCKFKIKTFHIHTCIFYSFNSFESILIPVKILKFMLDCIFIFY